MHRAARCESKCRAGDWRRVSRNVGSAAAIDLFQPFEAATDRGERVRLWESQPAM
jgi:hypothetical protein